MSELCREKWPQDLYTLSEHDFDLFLDHASVCSYHSLLLDDTESRVESLISLSYEHRHQIATEALSEWKFDSGGVHDLIIPVHDVPHAHFYMADFRKSIFEFADATFRYWIPYWIRLAWEGRGIVIALVICALFCGGTLVNLQRTTPNNRQSSVGNGQIESSQKNDGVKDGLHVRIVAQRLPQASAALRNSRIFNENISGTKKPKSLNRGNRMETGSEKAVQASKKILRLEVTLINPSSDELRSGLTIGDDPSSNYHCSSQSMKDGKCVLELEDIGDYQFELRGVGYKSSEINLSNSIETNEPQYLTLAKTGK
ncbi:MAG: hypothetical protein ABL952_02755 [Pyrinomonadaceae bacterium]